MLPFTRAASAARARPGPIASATCRDVVPAGTSRTLPSGRVTRIVAVVEAVMAPRGPWPAAPAAR